MQEVSLIRRNAMRNALLTPLLYVWLLSGCTAISVRDNLVTLDHAYFPPNVTWSSNKKLIAAYKQINSPIGAGEEAKGSEADEVDLTRPLPSYLVKDPLVRNVVVAAYQAIEEGKKATVEVTKADINGLTAALNNAFIVKGATDPIAALDSEKNISKIIRKYLTAYYDPDDQKGFVNREGTVFKRPEIKYSIGNDVITVVVGIFFEGLFDFLLDTPVYIDNVCKFQTLDGNEPSAHRFKFAKSETIVDQGKEGIETRELKAIRYLSGFAGDQSKALSGAAYRAFGGVDIGFVLGGKFSFGDNDTVAKMLDTVFEIVSKRIVEEIARQGFEKSTLENSGIAAKRSEAERLLRDL